MIIYRCSFYQVPAYCMQMMNYHKVSEQDRIKFELYMLLIVIEESYNTYSTERRARLRDPAFQFFLTLSDFISKKKSSKGPPSIFLSLATKWITKNPNASPLLIFFCSVRLFSKIIFPYRVPLQFFDVLQQRM